MLPIINAILPVTIVSLLATCLWVLDRTRERLKFVLLFWCVGTAADLALHIGRIVPAARFGGNMNWEGKLLQYCLVLLLVLLFSSWMSPKAIGLTFKQVVGSWRPSILVAVSFVLVVAMMTWVLDHGKETPSLETIAWNTCVFPDFVEELAYRGLLLAILCRAFPNEKVWLGIPIGWQVVLICFLFGLEHGCRFRSDYSLQVSWGSVLRTAMFSGFVFTWLRIKSGSLLMPTIAHAGAEAIAVGVMYIKSLQ
jgi:membrane protease YdiL (CAAX protease family)